MPTVFHPDHVALDKLFTTETKFIIPEYQRPYSWQSLGKSDKNNQINWPGDDLWEFFQDSRKDSKEYFLGSMVIIEPELRCYEVVDGQQRITSLTLLFAAMRLFLNRQLTREDAGQLAEALKQFVQRGLNKLQEIIYNEEGFGFIPSLKVKVKRAAGNGCDYDEILNLAVRGESLDQVESLDKKYRAIAKRYFANRDFFLRQLEEYFCPDKIFTEEHARQFNKFFIFLQKRVAIVTIKTQDFDTAFNIFEILNNRGLPLTNKDLLRNFIISKFSNVDNQDGSKRWEELEEEYDLTGDFIGRFVESTTGKQQRYSAFNDLKTLYDNNYRDRLGADKIVTFYSDLKRELAHYSWIVNPDEINDIDIATRVKLINQLGNVRYSTNLMMALFRHYSISSADSQSAAIADFLRAYQQYALHTLLAKGQRYSSKTVYEAIRSLLAGEPDAARKKFALTKTERSELVALLGGKLDNTTARALIAGYIWHQERTAGDDVVIQRLDFERASLEHILPQNPKKGSHWISDFPKSFRDDYTRKLGNMTLLTQRKNSLASRKSFDRKKEEVYRKTQLALTKELTQVEKLTPEYIKLRHERIVAGLAAELGLPNGR